MIERRSKPMPEEHNVPTRDAIFKSVFGLAEPQIASAIKADTTNWIESDYQEARMMLEALEQGNPKQYARFLSEWNAVANKDKLQFRQRCQMVQVLLSSFMDWRKTGVTTVKTKSDTISLVLEMARTGLPPITLSFQQVVDQFLQFDPPPHSAAEWAEVFAHGLRHPEPPAEGLRPIVRGSSTKRKAGRKPKAES